MPMTVLSIDERYLSKIRQALPYCLKETSLPFGKKTEGKVRDVYDLGKTVALITTDRLSAFDRFLTLIPYKGQVLNEISAWWFLQTKDIVPNHLIAKPHPNAVIVKKCRVFPVEFVVRGYITGSTSTSLWTQYQQSRHYCGLTFPEGLVKNQQLQSPVLTPTTKDPKSDRPISAEDIIAEGRMSKQEWHKVSELALQLYQYGVEVAAQHGLILVDTKYEFGVDEDGQILVIDEIHTPDSSRYWLADSYDTRFARGQEPENIDKEFLRLWYTDHCDPYNDQVLPQAPSELIEMLAYRYIQLYEMITKQAFAFTSNELPMNGLRQALASYGY